jgi:hypothetical protein
VAHHVAKKLAGKLRELDSRSQIAAVRERRATIEAITEAYKRARRQHAERARNAQHEGREVRLHLPGVYGRILQVVFDHLVEGAAAGAGREMTVEDAPVLAEAYRLAEGAVFGAVRAARAQAGGDKTRHRILRRAAVAMAPLVAVAIGYCAMRPSSLDLDVVEAIGKEQPAIAIAVLALSELGHSGESIARELHLDPATVRRVRNSGRLS